MSDFEIGDWVRADTVEGTILYGTVVHISRDGVIARDANGHIWSEPEWNVKHAHSGPAHPWETDPDLPVGYIVTSG